MNQRPLSPRLFRVSGSNYWSDEVMLAPRTHTDQRLAEVAALGYDAVWIHAELRQLHPTELFEPWEPDSVARLEALAVTVQRAAKHGVAIWLYACEPRSYDVDHPFWSAHPDCRGHLYAAGTHLGWRWPGVRKPLHGMCLGAEKVRQFLTRSTQVVFQAVPDLGGILVTTASEHHGHCYARFRAGQETMTCPRCVTADPTTMPALVANQMLQGVQAAGVEEPGRRLCFWSWSWHRHLEPAPCRRTIQSLPPQVRFMSIFEMGGDPVERGRRQVSADEYLFSHVGPSRNFQEQAAIARGLGRDFWAKLQISATHEIATVPNIPLPGVLYDKLARCRDHGVSGIMSIWTMGTLATLNSYAAGRLMQHDGPLPPREAWLRALAEDYFQQRLSPAQVDALRRGWEAFFAALQHHPIEVPFLYHSPINYAPAYPWTLQRQGTPMARSWTDEPWGDRLEMTSPTMPLAETADLLDRMASQWQAAAEPYAAALRPHEQACRRAFEERSVAEAISVFFRSCADVYRFAVEVDRGADAATLLALIDREEATCRRARQLVAADPRLGVHDDVIEPMVSPARIDAKLEKLADLRQQIAHAGGHRGC